MRFDLCFTFNRNDVVDEANYRFIAAVVAKWERERNWRSGARIQIGDNYIQVTDAEIHDDDFRFLLDCIERMQNYPVLDDMIYSEVELEFAQRVWNNMSIEDRVQWIKRYAAPNVSIFAARRNKIPPTGSGDEYALLAADYQGD